MSHKWRRSKQWDDAHIPPALWPLKAVLRAFSSISLAIVLLSLVAAFGTLASVPIGLLALAPTYTLYGATLVAAVAVVGLLPAWGIAWATRAAGAGRAGTFIAVFASAMLLGAGAIAAWWLLAWPLLRFDPAAGKGLRLFAAFADAYKSVPIRRLPALEMSELEFYGWWPLRVVLFAFVLNMIVATLRRIEFTFKNLGVLTVHTGIVTLALGSTYYARLKVEGDALLMAGTLRAGAASPLPGEPVNFLYDNTDIALFFRARGRESADWDERRLRGLPRFNDYHLDLLGVGLNPGVFDHEVANEVRRAARRRLNILTPPNELPEVTWRAGVPADMRARIVGYASYADLPRIKLNFTRGETPPGPAPPVPPAPQARLARLELVAAEDPSTVPAGRAPSVELDALSPRNRLRVFEGSLGIEFTSPMSESRWRSLIEPLPPDTRHALVIEVPAAGFRGVFPVSPGTRVDAGDTGWTVRVERLPPHPELPFRTPGYEDADSSVAVLRVEPPSGVAGGRPFARHVFHRFPELAQDFLPAALPGEMPTRRPPDPEIDIAYIDASITQVYVDEPRPGALRVLTRAVGEQAAVVPALDVARAAAIAPGAWVRVAELADGVDIPIPVASAARDKRQLGTHSFAAVAVEISLGDWNRVLWVPFSQYLDLAQEHKRTIRLPSGEEIDVVFGRQRHPLPMSLRLLDFTMTPYPHSDVPRDYESRLLLTPAWSQRDWRTGETRTVPAEVRSTSLNDPLLVRVPFLRREGASIPRAALGRAASLVAPSQYKFSQTGWDADGWRLSGEDVAAGRLQRRYVRYTILGVGNNPGIKIIAAGAILMVAGSLWAFGVKPLLVRRERNRLRAAAGISPPRTAFENRMTPANADFARQVK